MPGRLLTALALLAALLGGVLLPATGALGAPLHDQGSASSAGAGSSVGGPSAGSAVRASVGSRAVGSRSGSRALLAPAPAVHAGSAGLADPAVLPAAPVVVAPLLLVQRPRPPDGVPAPSFPAGPTGRSPPVRAAV